MEVDTTGREWREVVSSKSILDAMIALARDNPGQAVALVCDEQSILIGVLNTILYDEDWCLKPVTLKFFEELIDPGLTGGQDPLESTANTQAA